MSWFGSNIASVTELNLPTSLTCMSMSPKPNCSSRVTGNSDLIVASLSDHESMARRPLVMKQKQSSRRRRSSTKSVLRLPDLEHARTAVLNSLNSADAKRGYRHAIDEFVDWYCSERRGWIVSKVYRDKISG